MAQIILEFCPRCLRRLPRVIVNPPPFFLRPDPCGICRSETDDQARTEYNRRRARVRVWYTVPETYEVTRD